MVEDKDRICSLCGCECSDEGRYTCSVWRYEFESTILKLINNLDMELIQKDEQIGNLPVKMISDFEYGGYMDTKIFIQGGTLCYIAGNDRERFINAINEVIQRYRI